MKRLIIFALIAVSALWELASAAAPPLAESDFAFFDKVPVAGVPTRKEAVLSWTYGPKGEEFRSVHLRVTSVTLQGDMPQASLDSMRNMGEWSVQQLIEAAAKHRVSVLLDTNHMPRGSVLSIPGQPTVWLKRK